MQPLRILLVHNFYQYPGGEDVAFAAERDLLRLHGHEVTEYTDSNMQLYSLGRFSAGINTIWSSSSYRSIRMAIVSARPDIVHFHNTFTMISPSAYYACLHEGVPVVQTLHNFRLLCPVAVFYRDGGVCEECKNYFWALPSVIHACYHNSRLLTAGVATMLTAHRIIGTWSKYVNVYISLTEFSKQKYLESGIPETKVMVKPNFVTSINKPLKDMDDGFALFVGRLSQEKGVLTMLKAWKTLPIPIPLKIIGDGPLRPQVLKFIQDNPLAGVEYLEAMSRDRVIAHMENAQFLVFPSEWYEGFPLVIAESFSCGLPVIASSLGSMIEIVQDKITGIFFLAGSANDLAEKVIWLWRHPQEIKRMRRAARMEYEQKYTPEKNYQLLLEIYQKAMGSR